MSNPNADRPAISVAEVHKMLDEGKSRDEIRDHYKLTRAELAFLFRESTLRNRKSKKPVTLAIISDYTPPVKKSRKPAANDETATETGTVEETIPAAETAEALAPAPATDTPTPPATSTEAVQESNGNDW